MKPETINSDRKVTDICPSCKRAQSFPSGVRYASLKCSNCEIQLWVISRPDGNYLFDAKDEVTFNYYRARFRAIDRGVYANAGWVEQRDDKSLFHQLVMQRNFSLRAPQLIDYPTFAIGLDLSKIECNWPEPTAQQIEFEFEIRSLILRCFRQLSPDEICSVIDINHSTYTFLPREVDSDVSDFSKWPTGVLPIYEFVAFNNSDFSQGIFCNPSNRSIVVYGKAFFEPFAAAFPNHLIEPSVAVRKSS